MRVAFRSMCVSLLLAAAAHAAPPEFASLPYPTRALVQAGSENLLPSPGFAEGMNGWNTWGDVTLEDMGGERVLRFGPKVGDETSRIRVYLSEPKGGVLYLLRFEVKMTPEVGLDWGAGYPGLSGWLSHTAGGRSAYGCLRIRETRRSEQWLSREFRLFSHPEAEAVCVLLDFNGISGEALTRRWELIEEPIAVSEGRVVMQTPSGDWAQAPRESQPTPPSEPVLWAAQDPDALHPWSGPSDDERSGGLELAGTPGEMCVGAVGLLTGEALPDVTLSFTEPASGAGALGATPGWKWIVHHPRRTDFYGRGMTFHHVPDFFVERPEGVDCPAGGTTSFWVNLRLPDGAPAGLYEGRLRAHGDGVDLTIPVRVRVYPFRLAPPADRTRHMYLDAGRWREMTDAQVLDELADLRDHGYESTALSCRGRGTITAGEVTDYELSDEAIRGVRLALQAGLTGPFMFWGGWLPSGLARQLRLPPETMRDTADKWPAALGAAMTKTLKLIKAELAKLGVDAPVLVAVDEPGYWKKGSPERLAWDVKTARDAGWPVYCTSSEPPSDPLGQGLEYHCYGGGKVILDPLQAKAAAEETRDAGQRFWYYTTGSYSGQIGNMLRNRYLAGFLFFRCGADGTASWTFQRPRGNAFDDFLVDERTGKPRTGQACITYPDPENPGRNLDTPQWEGLRQAHYDHRYAQTLAEAIEAAREENPEAAGRAERVLSEALAGLPWNGDPFLWPEMTNARLGHVRATLADAIIALAPD